MEPEEKDLRYFHERFNALADEAQSYGLNVTIALESSDPIARESGIVTIYRGTRITSLGLLHHALMEFQIR